ERVVDGFAQLLGAERRAGGEHGNQPAQERHRGKASTGRFPFRSERAPRMIVAVGHGYPPPTENTGWAFNARFRAGFSRGCSKPSQIGCKREAKTLNQRVFTPSS